MQACKKIITALAAKELYPSAQRSRDLAPDRKIRELKNKKRKKGSEL